MRMKAISLSGVLILPLLTTGCVEATDPCAEVRASQPALELGTGNLDFLSLQDGDMIGAHYGPQGGYHVYGSIHATGVYPGSPQEIDRFFNNSGTDGASLERLNPMTSYTVTDNATGDVVAERQLQNPLMPQDDMYTRMGDIVFFPIGMDPVEGTNVTFQMTMTDMCGNELTDEIDNLTLYIQDPGPM
jgi:hypothetical protein